MGSTGDPLSTQTSGDWQASAPNFVTAYYKAAADIVEAANRRASSLGGSGWREYCITVHARPNSKGRIGDSCRRLNSCARDRGPTTTDYQVATKPIAGLSH